jgi:hypothetical protein
MLKIKESTVTPFYIHPDPTIRFSAVQFGWPTL